MENKKAVIDKPTEELDKVEPNIGDYSVKAYNNDITTFMDVVGVFIISCGYDHPTAIKFTKEIHEVGFSVCFWGSKRRCESVIKDFKAIGVKAILMEAGHGTRG